MKLSERLATSSKLSERGAIINIQTFYTYLTRARRDLWAFLESLPDEVLSKSVIPAERMRSIKDIVLHIAVVEDSWLHEDILRDQPVWERTIGFPKEFEKPFHDAKPLSWLLEYWKAVEASTLAHLGAVTDAELAQRVTVMGSTDDVTFSANEVLWHVAQHETRHTAQLALLGRLAGYSPPQLDLIKYLRGDHV